MEDTPWVEPYTPQMTREQELSFLESQAEALASELDMTERRLKELRE